MPGEDYYSLLGVQKGASEEEIKRAFRKKAHELHPDKGGDAEQFKKVNEAYQVLSDKEKRSHYDTFGSSGNAGGGYSGGGFGSEGFSSEGFGFGGGFGDIFSEMFGAAMAHIQAEVQISVAQAVLGDTLDIRAGNDHLKLEIPPGTQDGQQVTFRGKGKAYRGGRGDLIILLRVIIPRRVSRKERELYEQLKKIQ
jgi:DnaJ-class molecular chaperone